MLTKIDINFYLDLSSVRAIYPHMHKHGVLVVELMVGAASHQVFVTEEEHRLKLLKSLQEYTCGN